MPRIFAYFRDTEARREALASGGAAGGLFSGAMELAAGGWEVGVNLEERPGTVAHHVGTWISGYLHGHGGYGGDFASCLKTLGRANRAEAVWSTVDTLGIPLSVLKGWGLLRPPLVYTSIGLVERFRDLPDSGWKRRQLKAIGGSAVVVGYGWEEVRVLREWFPETRVEFVRYAVDTAQWQPLDREKAVDVLSLGMDGQRDFGCLLPFARANPGVRVKIITSRGVQAELGEVPANVELCDPVPLGAVREEMAGARVIALPVRENTYSGATTTLLQAMAMGLPVVVGESGAIREGYGFRERGSCVPVPPGDGEAMAVALSALLGDAAERDRLGERAVAHVREAFTWERFVSDWEAILRSVCGGDSV